MRGKPLKVDVAIDKLETGKVYRDYRAICDVLGESSKTGSSKNAQLKNWERNFKYDRNGRKYIIKAIYNIPLPFTRKVKVNESKSERKNLSESKIGKKENMKNNKIELKVTTKKPMLKANMQENFMNSNVIKHMLIQQQINLFSNQVNLFTNQMNIAKSQMISTKDQIKQLKTELKEVKL